MIGDSGTGKKEQKRVALQMERFHAQHPWEFVLMLGDNIYENGEPKYFDRKFKKIYRNLMQNGVRFHASLGNHDRRSTDGWPQVQDEAFGYVGKQDEYVLAAGGELSNGKTLARFICLNSAAWVDEIKDSDPHGYKTRLDRLREWLAESQRYQWNFVYMHHPIHAYVKKKLMGLLGGHGSTKELIKVVEPELLGRVDVVLAGHDHFYQKVKPHKGIHHFVSGAAAKLRKGEDRTHPNVEFAGREYHFVDMHLSEDKLEYQAINEDGRVFHSGAIAKNGARPTVAEIRTAAYQAAS